MEDESPAPPRPSFGPAARIGLAAALLCAAMLVFFWPGVATYDSVVQYRQVLSGDYDDWHPPVMARLWSLLHLAAAGQAPMFVLQALLWWSGLGLFAAALARGGSRFAAIGVLALGIWPPFAGWEPAVLKDGQLAGALLAAIGLAAWWRLREARTPGWAVAVIAMLLVYATLLRFNSVFATVPLAFGLMGEGRWDRPFLRGAAMLAAAAFALLLLPGINHGLLGARPSGVERALPVYDLAGITHYAGPEAAPVLPADDWRRAGARGCITPVFWDPLTDEKQCAFIAEGLEDSAPGHVLFAAWEGAILHHPLAYAAHRIAHWNATMRWWVPAGMPFAAPTGLSEPNDVGLASPSPWIKPFMTLAGWIGEGPLGAPILWFAAALAVLALAWPGKDARQRLAVTLALSAVLTELAFLLVSIASDIRYHLPAMLMTGLAVPLLLTGEPLPRRRTRAAFAAVGAVALSCFAARLALV
jgi:hypothetical protein